MENLLKLFDGRLGRLHYFLGVIFIEGVSALILTIAPSIVLSLLLTALTLPIAVRRVHDIGFPGFWAVGRFLSYFSYFGGIYIAIALVFDLCLYIIRGTQGVNKYGEAPKPGLGFIDAILNKTEASDG